MHARLLSLIPGAAALLCLPAVWADEWSKQWSVAGKPDLRVDVDDGRIVVHGADIRQVEARVFTTGWKISPDDVRITERQSGDRVELEVHVPRYQRWINVGNRSLRVELRVPRALAANIRTGDGSIQADSLAGTIRLRTGDGRIEADSFDGALDCETGDGSLRVSGRFDVMNLHTGDGSIEAEVKPGSKMTATWEVTTGDGHITLGLPDGFSADLDAHTNDGRVSLDMPVTASRLQTGSDIHGKLNAGGPTLRVRTGDGAIRLARR